MVGKYVNLTDSYKSLNEALHHGGIAHRTRVEIEYYDSEKLVNADELARVHGILVPHGFGSRGVEGKIAAVRFARERRIPFFGICFGMQLAVIEFARNVAGLERANSAEVDPETPHPVIDLMPEQRTVSEKGATMRLGGWPCVLREGTRAYEAYGVREVSERHRHRYEFNPEYRDQLSRAGLVLSGTSPDGRLIEVVELADHPWFLGSQFHPEFQSGPFDPHPLFTAFVGAAIRQSEKR
jgi:CTP synthase